MEYTITPEQEKQVRRLQQRGFFSSQFISNIGTYADLPRHNGLRTGTLVCYRKVPTQPGSPEVVNILPDGFVISKYPRTK